jgi:prepilin-type processing-associated H-X9-DG protein
MIRAAIKNKRLNLNRHLPSDGEKAFYGKNAEPQKNVDLRISQFTLIELLVVIGIISLLMLMTAPALMMAKEMARKSSCSNNISSISKANMLYCEDYGKFVAAAEDVAAANLTRWHGKRNTADYSENFDFTKSALYQYIGGCADAKTCPVLEKKVNFDLPAYEKGGRGYGYNEGIGSKMYFVDNPWSLESCQEGLPISAIKNPTETIMFSDSACEVDDGGNHSGSGRLAENSFAQSPYYVFGKVPVPGWGLAWPTIHFRHVNSANISYCDGHISSEKMLFSNSSDWEKQNLGWFGPADNSYFDPF